MSQVVLEKSVFERRGFRQFLSSLAEWCSAHKGKGEKMGGGREASRNGRFPPAAHLLPLGLIRSRAPFRRERSERAESPSENHENTPIAATEKALAKLDFSYLCRKYRI